MLQSAAQKRAGAEDVSKQRREERVPSSPCAGIRHSRGHWGHRGGWDQTQCPRQGKVVSEPQPVMVFLYTQGKTRTYECEGTQEETRLPWPQGSYSGKHAFISEDSTLLGLVWSSTFYFP